MLRKRRDGVILAASIALLLSPAAQAVNLYWDADGDGSATTGGSGTWDATSLWWRTDSATGALQAYSNAATTGTATFGGTNGTVAIASNTTINANYLSFTVGKYVIAGTDATSSLKLDGVAPTISVTSGTATISAIVAGSNGFSKVGTSVLALTGVNTYTGPTAINAGTLRADEGVGLGTGALVINNGTFETGANLTRALGNGSGQVQLSASGSNISTGFSAYGAPVVVSIGGVASPTALTWGDSSFNPSTGTGAFTLNASTANNAIEFKNAIDLNNTGSAATRTISVGANVATISGVLSNSNAAASLTKTGAGTLALTAKNTYTGTTKIGGGTLRADEGTGLGSGALVINNGAFETAANFVRSLGTGAGQVQISATGSNMSTGFSAFGGPVVLALGGIDSPTALTWGDANFNPTTGTGSFYLNTATSTDTIELKNAIDLNNTASAVTRSVFVGARTATMSGVLSNSGADAGLSKSGTGTLVLTAANTYTGLTSVTAGTLQLGNSKAIQKSSGVSVSSGASLDLNGYSIGNALTVNGSLTNSVANKVVLNGSITSSSGMTFSGVAGSTIAVANSLTSGANVTKSGLGNVILSASNALSANFYLNQGGLGIAHDNALDGATSLTFNCNNADNASFVWAEGGARTIAIPVKVNVNSNTHGSVIYTGVNDLTFTGMYSNIYSSGGGTGIAVNNTGLTTFSGGFTLAGTASAVPTLYIRGSGNVLINSAIVEGNRVGTGSLVYCGPGSLTISSTNSIGSVLRVNGGTVRMTGLNTTGTSSIAISGGTLNLDLSAGNDRWNNSSPLTIAGGDLLISGASSGASSQTLGGLTTSNGMGTIVVNKNGGSGTSLTLGNTWSRTNNGTLLIDLSSGGTLSSAPTTVTNGLVTSNAGSGVLYAVVKDASGYGFAASSGGSITRYTGGTALAATSSNSATNFIVQSANDSLSLSDGVHAMNSLQIDTSAGDGTLNLGTTNGAQVTLSGQAVLMSGAHNYTITSGTLGSSGSEVVIYQYGTGTLTINSTISGGSGGITKSGDGLLVVGGPQAYTGKTIIQAGALQAIDGSGLPSTSALGLSGGVFQGTGTFTRSLGTSGGNVFWDTANGGGFSASTGTFAIQLNNGTGAVQWGALNFLQDGKALILGSASAGGVVDFQNTLDLGSIPYAGTTREITVVDNAASSLDRARISGNIISTGLDIGLLKDGNGILELTGVNSYTGATYISGGTLSVASLANGGLNSNIGASSSNSENLQIDGGVFQYTGAAASSDRLFSAGVNGATLDASGSGALSLNNTGAMGFVGDRTSSRTLTLTGTNKGSNTLSASISDPTTSGSTSVAKTGAGTWVLSGSNAYTGKTTVSEGKLVVSGSLSATKAVSVAEGAELNVTGFVNHSASIALSGKLSGNGSVGAVSVDGTGEVNPGADGIGSIGTLVVQNFSLASTSHVNFDLNALDHTAGNNINDLIVVNGDLLLDGVLNVNSSSPLSAGTYTLFTFTGNLNDQTMALSSAFLSSYSGSYITANGKEIDLVVVPEPSTWAMMMGGVGLLVFGQRMRRRAVLRS